MRHIISISRQNHSPIMEEADSLRPQSFTSRHIQEGVIEGMESVVATVSGYHGSERFNLIKLISSAGANYTGAMSSSITHLVCWKFEGRKYDLAKKFRTIIVNHQWVEECIKQGKRVSEHPYTLQSGLEVGPLLLEPPLTNTSVSSKNDKRLSDHSNVRNHRGKELNDMGLGGSSDAVWIDSCLLKENLFPEVGQSNGKRQKSKRKSTRISEQESLGSSKLCFHEPSLSGLDRMEEESSSHSSMHLGRGKRKISNAKKGNPFPESSYKGRKLVKKNVVGRDRFRSLPSDSDDECYLVGAHNNSNLARSGHSNGARNIGISEHRIRSEGRRSHLVIESEDEEVEEIMDCDHVPNPHGSNICLEGAAATLETPLQDGVSDVENLKKHNDDGGQLRAVNISPTFTELSCVICLTDFSSTRGVLPCGHRFCYSCIQNWSDHLIARGMVSTCPLCKANFATIQMVEGAVISDQKIYSQTVPHSSSTMDIFIPIDRETFGFGAQSSRVSVCSACCSREPEDCLISCHVCQTRCIHSYCLDPLLLPWTCTLCKDLGRLYRHSAY